MAIELPPNVTAQRKPISPTSYEYIFRHSELGQLGRLLLNVCASGTSRIICLVHGQPGDTLTEQRRAVFEPLAHKLAEQMRSKLTFAKGPTDPQLPAMA
ncbi:hypothetical protein GCM10007205_16970 [Oxalicibacterium flavum]|uniref:Uncharacterized protein n=1 Tax=Oxalicibacterium flavum TaxID=179467 RepID=A0A8J2UKP6_9BURK|nr:hypothetical protein [Oxalicibacterium flavum]GGC08509.1 hypothetical protein GCM10007205_16970 [Oxalicibacterium flavum]